MTLPDNTQKIFETAINDVFKTFQHDILYNAVPIKAGICFPNEVEIQNNLINYDAVLTVKKEDVTLPVAGDVVVWESINSIV